MKNLKYLLPFLLIPASLQAQQDIKPIYKNTLKTTFLSYITGSAKLTYERATFPGQSFEITGGIIGAGFDKFKVKPRGGLFRTGYKFIFSQSLSGLYLKPEYAFSAFDFNSKNADRIHSQMQTIMCNVGYQWIIKRLVLDGFVGIGVGWGNKTELNYHHGFIDRYGWLTLSFGMRVGIAF